MVVASGSCDLTLAEWIRHRERSPLREMVALVAQPDILSLAGGLPAPEFFPVEEYGEALQRVLAEDPRCLQYCPPFEPLKAQIAELMIERGVRCAPEQVFLTTGAQQGIDILTRLFLEHGGEVMMEEVVYTGVQQSVGPYRPQILTVGTDLVSGMEVTQVEDHLRGGARPAYIYVVPDAHNPLGVSLSEDKRHRLVEIAAAYGVPIIEDDPYGLLYYDEPFAPPLRALDEDWVFYLGSFSKILAPALRLGWMIVPEDLVPRVTVVKEAADLESSALTQRAVSSFFESGYLRPQIERLRQGYGERRDALLEILADAMPAGSRWTEPAGGMFVWVELAAGTDCSALLRQAIEKERLAFIPGSAFAVSGGYAENCMRLSFSTATPDQIEDGVRRLARLLS